MTFYFQAPDLAEFPRRSYRRFLEETIGTLFAEISPIASEYSPRFEVSFLGQDGKVHWRFEDYAPDSGYPATAEQARKSNMTHARRMLMDIWLRDTQTGELRKSTTYMADLPVITDRGTFVINGSERVVLGQLVRAPGIYFQNIAPGTYKALLLAERGAPLTFELELDPQEARNSRAKLRIKLPKRGWVAATTLLIAMGASLPSIHKRLGKALARHRIDWRQLTESEALSIIGRSWKPDGSGGIAGGVSALKDLTDRRRYSLGTLGRKRVNTKIRIEESVLNLTVNDVFATMEYLLGLPCDTGTVDNMDSLENRHLRGVGDILMRTVRPALAQMARSTRTRLELLDENEIGSPNDLIDTRPFVNAVSKFFGGNPLVQYLDQQNPLSELSHRRRITSFGPGGIDPNAAPVEMRDIHPSQIGRVCLIESPEGKSCGMVAYLATYCRIDEDGFLTVPYRRVINGQVTDEIAYLAPADDKKFTLAPPDTKVDKDGFLVGALINCRRGELFFRVAPQEIDFIGIAPQGFVSVGSSLIPFLEHDDANRALMGGGMMRQTLPLIKPERPRVGTGMEKVVAQSSGHSVAARRAGEVIKVDGNEIVIRQASREARTYPLIRFERTNQNTILDQRPAVAVGQKVEAGQIIADGPAIDNGELALGRNLLIAFLSWRGQNFEDAIVVRAGLVKDQKLSHIEIEKHSISVHQTLRGPEILTPELPNVATKDLEHLDERGIAKIGSYVEPGSILVAKLTPKEQRALSAEEELLQAVFGKVAEEMSDNSLRTPHGMGGRVIDVRIFTPETTPELKAGIICEIEVLVARLCPLEVGDKLAGRHGNKGIVSIVVPDQDMPYLPDGTPVDLILNPLGVPSRMNVGQVFDTQLGLYADILNRYYRIHQFDESFSDDASYKVVSEALAEVRKTPGFEWVGEDGKVVLYDGMTGEPMDQPILVGRQYMLKLNQLVLHKINARSGLGGPYTAVTQQPVGGKANHGGQRMGEMEVWAIQAYGSAHLLNEMMTIKADDIQGRHQSYTDIVQGNNISPPGRTAAFDGLCCEIRGLGMEVTLGSIVDTFEPLKDKSCTRGPVPETLEEQYMVSAVNKLETDGVKILEIPAGDYVPAIRPLAQPVITSMINDRHGGRPQLELSDEPLIDEPEESASYMDAFIESETKDLVSTSTTDEQGAASSEPSDIEDEPAGHAPLLSPALNESAFLPANLSNLITQWQKGDKATMEFSSLAELQSLAYELVNINQDNDKVGVIGSISSDTNEGDEETADHNPDDPTTYFSGHEN